MNVNNKKVWITGASSGIGKELAIQLAAKGARIILSARNQSALEALCEQLPGGSEHHWVVPFDLSDPDKALIHAEELAAKHVDIDVLIHSGGVSQRSLFMETELSVYRRLMEVNYLSMVALNKAVISNMAKRKSGHIVAISSVAGLVGSKLRSGYSGSKFAIVGFMDCIRAELAQYNIHCLSVCPGSINTNVAINSLTSKGEPQGENEDTILNGMDVKDCCREIVRALEKGKDQVVIGEGISGLAPTIKRFFPGFFNRLSAKTEYR